MAELDLSKAVEAIDRALWNGHDIDAPADIIDTALTAALPHILDALAEQAYGEAMAMSYGLMEGDYEVPKATSEWLSQKAEEMRHG